MTRTLRPQDRWKALAPLSRTWCWPPARWWRWSAVVGGTATALGTCAPADARHAALNAQLQRMQGLQAEAQASRGQPGTSPGDAVGAGCTAITQRLGNTAQLNAAGRPGHGHAQRPPADALAEWLARATPRHAARSPADARMHLLLRRHQQCARHQPQHGRAMLLGWQPWCWLCLPPASADPRTDSE